MLLATLSLFLLQSGDVERALADAAALADQNRFENALLALDSAGTDEDPRILTARGTYKLRIAENKGAAGALQGDRLNMAFLEAAETLEKAAGMKAPPVEAFVNWSEALLNIGDNAAALRALQKSQKAFPDGDVQLALQEGRVRVAMASAFAGVEDKEREQREKAREVFRAAMEKYPDSAAACLRCGEMEVYLGNAEAAERAWGEAFRRDAAAVDVGAMRQWIGDEASARLLEAAVARKEDPLLFWWLGYVEYQIQPYLSRWDDAKKNFLRALKLNPELVNTWFFLGQGAMARGQALQAENKETEARAEFKLAAQAWGKYLDSYGANHLEGLRQTEDQGALEISRLQWLGGKAYEWNDWPAAVSIARWTTLARPEEAEVWNNLAFLLRETRQYEESLRAYRKADSLRPDDPQILNDMAVILHYYLHRDEEEAAGMYERAIARAEALLAQTDSLEEAERQRVRIALRDANNNLKLLRGETEEQPEGGGESEAG